MAHVLGSVDDPLEVLTLRPELPTIWDSIDLFR